MYIGVPCALFRAPFFASIARPRYFVHHTNSHVEIQIHTNMYSKLLGATPYAPPPHFCLSLVLFCTILLAVQVGKLNTSLIYKQSKLIGYQICKGLVVISDGDLAMVKGSIPAVCLGW